MGKRGYHATGEKEELVCKVWEKKPQAGSNEEKCRDSVSPSPSPSISVRVQRLWEAMLELIMLLHNSYHSYVYVPLLTPLSTQLEFGSGVQIQGRRQMHIALGLQQSEYLHL